MAITHATATRNAIADLVADAHDAGAGAGELLIRDGSNNVLVTIPLADPAFGAASSGAVAATVPRGAVATASGTAANFITRDSNGTQILAGSVTAGGGGGDITLSSTSITSGEAVIIDALTYTAPA